MTKLLRALSLSVLLAFAAFSTSGAASSFGTCRTLCYGSGFPPTGVTWTTTYEGCCGGAQNPCPPGTTPRTISFNGFRCGV